MKKRNQTCGDTRSSANTRADERRKTLSLVTAVIMAVSCIACVIIKAVRKDCFSVHEILLYAAWALLAAESFLAAFSNGSRIQKVLRILLAAAAIGLASVSFIILTICTKRITMRNNTNKSKRMVRIICIILAALFLLSLIIVPLIYVFG